MTKQQGLDGCKLGQLCQENPDYGIPEVVWHIGANDGYEIPFYLAMGVRRVLAFEPMKEQYNRLAEKFGDNKDVFLSTQGFWHRDAEVDLYHVTGNDMQDSAFTPIDIDRTFDYNKATEQKTWLKRFAQFHMRPSAKSALVLDVQGAEFNVLVGMGERIRDFDVAVIEVSKEPLWYGAARGQTIADYMEMWNFVAADQAYYGRSIPNHDDMFFLSAKI